MDKKGKLMIPAISVIVPVYNVEKYLCRCVDSILTQTYTDFELILVDDGSSDDCGVLCNEYAKQDSRVRVIHKTNDGVSSARNTGLKIANGEFLSFIDSDDYVDRSFLEKVKKTVETGRIDLVICGYQYSNNASVFIPQESTMTNIEALRYYSHLNNSVIHAPWGKLVKTDIAKAFMFPIDRSYGEDFAVIYKWIYASKYINSISDILYYYEIREDSLSSDYDSKRLGNIISLNEIIAFCESIGETGLSLHYRIERIGFDYYNYTRVHHLNKNLSKIIKKDLKLSIHSISKKQRNDLPYIDKIYYVLYPFEMRVRDKTIYYLKKLNSILLKRKIN